jgi:hypothetical protein
MELHRPKEDKLPYVCLITFAAAGGANGDIVQVSVVVVGDNLVDKLMGGELRESWKDC